MGSADKQKKAGTEARLLAVSSGGAYLMFRNGVAEPGMNEVGSLPSHF